MKAGQRSDGTFVALWNERLAKRRAPAVAAGVVRRLDLSLAAARATSRTKSDHEAFIDGIVDDIRRALGVDAVFWSPGPGLIDILYPKMLPDAADLAHSVVQGKADLRIRNWTAQSDALNARPAPGRQVQRLVPWEAFERACRKAKIRPEQVQTVDISALAFGKSDAKARLSRRVWNIVEDVVNEFLDRGGYCTRYTGNTVLFAFPGFSTSLAQLKARAIAGEIGRAIAAQRGRTQGDEVEVEASDKTEGERPPDVIDQPVITSKEKAELDKAFALMAARVDARRLSGDELATPSGVRFGVEPIWRADSFSLIGRRITVTPPDAAGADIDLPLLAYTESDVLQSLDLQNPHIVIVPVHWKTLDHTANRARYLELVERVAAEARRYLVLSVHGIPEDLMASRIEGRIYDLRNACRALTCHVPLDRRDFEQLRGLSFYAVGTSPPRDGAGEGDTIAAMDAFLDAQRHLATRSFIVGLTTRSLVIAALAAGFDFLSGPAIADDSHGGVRSFSIPDLFARPAKDSR